MNRTHLTLPEVPVTPLPANRLEAMINRALTYPQHAAQTATVLPFASRLAPFAYTGGLTAMAASILLAFTFMPLPGTQTSAENTATPLTDDLPAYLLYSTLSS